MSKSKFLIVGLGKTGLSIARYLQRQGADFVVFDTRKMPDGVDEFRHVFPHGELFLYDFPAKLYAEIAEIISSPGVSLDEPFLQEARARNIPIIGDIELLARHVKVPIIAITGTNGKSTVTTLVGEMMKAANLAVAVAGNIGVPVLDLLTEDACYDVWVLELSSFQLDLISSLAPMVATILNVTPDHLDRHRTMDAYITSKQKIYRQAKNIIFNRDDMATVANRVGAISFGTSEPAAGQWGLLEVEGVPHLAYGQECLLAANALKIKGIHNWINALAASAVAHVMGVSLANICQVLRQFAGLPHRTQWVRTLNGVEWINDSKGTNIGATISAIAGIGSAIQGKVVLIAGGQGKGANFVPLRETLMRYARAVVLLGQDAPLIEQAVSGAVPIHRVHSLADAVRVAQQTSQHHDVVLLSPACASFDMFRDFNHRGDLYTTMVNAL